MTRPIIKPPIAWWAMNRQRKRRRARISAPVDPLPMADPFVPPDFRMRLIADSIEELALGDSIPLWPDQSENANDATQETISSQPTLQEVTFAGKTFRIARFDTVDDGMVTPLVISDPSPFSIFVLWRPADLGFTTAIISSGSQDWTMGTYAGGMICYFSTWTTGEEVNIDDFYLFEVRITPGQEFTWAYLNGIQTDVFGPESGSAPPEQVTLGAAGSTGYPGGCDAAEILIYDRFLSDEEAAGVRADFQSRYNFLKL